MLRAAKVAPVVERDEECEACGGHGYKRAGNRGVARVNDRAAKKCETCDGSGRVLL